jgi:hypothetical protein
MTLRLFGTRRLLFQVLRNDGWEAILGQAESLRRAQSKPVGAACSRSQPLRLQADPTDEVRVAAVVGLQILKIRPLIPPFQDDGSKRAGQLLLLHRSSTRPAHAELAVIVHQKNIHLHPGTRLKALKSKPLSWKERLKGNMRQRFVQLLQMISSGLLSLYR